MAILIEDPELGYYYKGLVPYVENMRVSLDIETNQYSLECDETYNHKKYIGLFYGYPGSMDSECKLIPGINHANGVICIQNIVNNVNNVNNMNNVNNYIKVINGLIKESDIEESSIIDSNIIDSNNTNPVYRHKIVPQCTNVECGINSNSELMIHHMCPCSSNKMCGMFYGTPGEFYYDDKIKGYNRIYGDEYSTGTIILHGRYNFKYNYDKGKISSIIFK